MFRKHTNLIRTVAVLAVIGLCSQSGQAEQSGKTSFDFSDYDSVLSTFVNEKAMVN